MLKSAFKKHKFDLILLAALLLAGCLAALALTLFSSRGNAVRVTVDGKETAVFPLDKDLTYGIAGANGGTNLLVIENGSAYVTNSTCPDHLCEKTGRINKVGQSVICLPNRVIVEITGGDGGVDAVAG